jgi:hypothetical protein
MLYRRGFVGVDVPRRFPPTNVALIEKGTNLSLAASVDTHSSSTPQILREWKSL